MKKILYALVSSFILISCGGDEAGPRVERLSSDYQPNTVGSTWTYHADNLVPDVTHTVTNKTKSINGETYYEIEVEFPGYPPGLVYARKENGKLISYESVNGIYAPDSEWIILQDAEVGTTWNEILFGGTEDENHFELEVIETGGTYTVGEYTFTDVLVIKVTNVTNEESQPYSLNYYAKGIGHIQSASEEGEVIIQLIDYHIVE